MKCDRTLRWYDVIIKNTFIDLEEKSDDGGSGDARRSYSVPRTWKPGTSSSALPLQRGLPSDASVSSSTTAASLSSHGEAASDAGEESDLAEGHTAISSEAAEAVDFAAPDAIRRTVTGPAVLQSVVPTRSPLTRLNPEAVAFSPPSSVSLVPVVAEGSSLQQVPAPRLNPQARAFEPTAVPPPAVLAPPALVQQAGPSANEEVLNAAAAAAQALRASPSVTLVKVVPGENQVTVVAEVVGSSAQGAGQETLSLAKDALLAYTANSPNTYILGYAESPFKDLCDSGFRAVMGSVPAELQDKACWDTYQSGFCPRRETCRWCHPGEAPGNDLTIVRVILKKMDK